MGFQFIYMLNLLGRVVSVPYARETKTITYKFDVPTLKKQNPGEQMLRIEIQIVCFTLECIHFLDWIIVGHI